MEKMVLKTGLIPDMNIQEYLSNTRLEGSSIGANQPSPQPRQQAAPPASASNISREAAQKTPEARPILDLSDTALTRRDIPRGTLIDIIA
jgi:hypothetical protein